MVIAAVYFESSTVHRVLTWFTALGAESNRSEAPAGGSSSDVKGELPPSVLRPAAPDLTATSATQLLSKTNLGPENAETRLIEIYALIEQGQFHTALEKAQSLVKDRPNFQLAQLVHADLLRLRFQPDAVVSDASHAPLLSLRTESRKRLDALRNRPPPGTIPHQFVALATGSQHAIAIDASHSRLYLFENKLSATTGANGPPNLQLVADFFISVGKSGIDKRLEGDGRTPLGNYYITSTKDSKSLPPFYGAGALPINYPNAFDNHHGRTGSGIWLHGTPPDQFVRAPLASDGCVVLSNPDMEELLTKVAPRTTPVVIAEKLQWVEPHVLTADRNAFETVLAQWQNARSTMTAQALAQTFGQPVARRPGNGSAAVASLIVAPHIKLGVTNVSLLQSRLPDVSMVATFDETVDGSATNVTRRQYWLKQNDRWQLLQDTVLSGVPSANLKRPPPPGEIKLAAADRAVPDKGQAEAQVSAAAERPAKQPVASGDAAEQGQVRQAVQAWARAWSQKNMKAYLNSYDTTFDPPGGLSRKAWEKDRADRIVYKSKISVNLTNIQIKVNGNQATVTFLQRYQADQLSVSGRKTLRMIKRGKDWRIAQESIG